jgi:regulator of replication initiation timing
LAQAQATFGVSTGYVALEFPKALHRRDGKSAIANDPDHQKLLEAEGYSAPAFAPVKGTGNLTAGGVSSAYNPKEYPRAIYHQDGKSRVVQNPGELAEFEAQGWSAKPFPAHLEGTKKASGAPVSGPGPSAALEASLVGITNEHIDLQNKHQAVQADFAAAQAKIDDLVNTNAALLLDNELLKKTAESAQAELKSAGNTSKAKIQSAFDDLKARFDAMSVERDALLEAVSGLK